MKKEFVEYLELIGLTDVIIKRIEDIYRFYEESLKKLDDEILGIFVTDYMPKDGLRQYENIWFFSNKYFMEAKLFYQKDDFDIEPAEEKINYIQVEKNDYDFLKATDKSRLYIRYTSSTLSEGELKASKENCDCLKEIYFKYLLPNFKR
jgi:hypothetical protein